MRYIWARVFVACLIFLGDWAFAADSRLRVEIEAVASDIVSQISNQTILDDPESGTEPAIMGVGTTLPVIFTINNKLAPMAHIVSARLEYLPSQPRAPPQTTTR